MNAAPVADEAGLWLFVRAVHRLLALPADLVERALLVDEAAAPRWPAELGPAVAPRGCLGLLEVRSVAYGAWDLGLMLGTSSARRSWILLQLPLPGGTLAAALRTDECLHVGRLPRAHRLPLPAGILKDRPAFRTAFPAADAGAARGGERSLVGLEMDLLRLWTDYELEFTRELLRQADDRA